MADIKEIISKVSTNIEGLDRLLYGGLDMRDGCHVVFVRGGQDSERTMLAMQMMYGISQSLHKLGCDVIPEYFSTYHDATYLNDMLLDTCISQYIKELMVMYVSTPEEERNEIANTMTSCFFDTDDEEIKTKSAYAEVVANRILNLVLNKADYLLGKEVLYYSNRTNGIHLRSARHPADIYADSDTNNLLFHRSYNSVSEYFSKKGKFKDKLNDFFKNPLVDVTIEQKTIDEIKKHYESKEDGISVIAIDVHEYLREEDVNGLIEIVTTKIRNQKYKDDKGVEHKYSSVLIFALPTDMKVPEYLADTIIRLETIRDVDYIYRQLSFIKSRRQTTVLGYHKYKRRDYGLEIYPGIQTYFEQRRYLQRALVYTHSGVLSETYQQYIDRKKGTSNEKAGYQDYNAKRAVVEKENFEILYPNYDQGLSSVDILDKIMLSQTSPYAQSYSRRELSLNYQGCVTAIIGVPNTYKRFLTFGSIFSSSLNDEHTLILMLNKDDAGIKRRLSCPARAGRPNDHSRCIECYRKIHFMNICMGNITPDELIYHLIYQLDNKYKDGKKIKRVVIDDLQIIDYCFPSLEKDKMFLPALASVCKEKGIDLYILCDKQCSSVDSLRAVSDNIVCTSRDKDGRLLTYIERYTGYQNTPSKIYTCSIKNVKDLFECYEEIDEDDNQVSLFELNSKCVESKSLFTTEFFWNSENNKQNRK